MATSGNTLKGETPEAFAVEGFSDFRSEGGLNLPHTYKFELSIQSEVRPALVDWKFGLTDFNLSDVSEFK